MLLRVVYARVCRLGARDRVKQTGAGGGLGGRKAPHAPPWMTRDSLPSRPLSCALGGGNAASEAQCCKRCGGAGRALSQALVPHLDQTTTPYPLKGTCPVLLQAS